MEITPEVDFGQQLASSEPNVRDSAIKNLGKWLQNKSLRENAFNEDGMLKLWKGLYYYFWFSDKPLIQEEAADKISKYIHLFKNIQYSFLFLDAFFQTLARAWHGIDHYRIDKYMMLARRVLRQSFVLLKSHNWKLRWIKQYRKVMKKTVMNPDSAAIATGLKCHLTDIYMEELALCGGEELSSKKVLSFLVPYCRALVLSKDLTFLKSISKNIFLYFLCQEVDDGKTSKLPSLKYDADDIKKLLLKFIKDTDARTQNIKVIQDILISFKDYQDEDIEKVTVTSLRKFRAPKPIDWNIHVKRAVEHLLNETELPEEKKQKTEDTEQNPVDSDK